MTDGDDDNDTRDCSWLTRINDHHTEALTVCSWYSGCVTGSRVVDACQQLEWRRVGAVCRVPASVITTHCTPAFRYSHHHHRHHLCSLPTSHLPLQ